MRSWRGAEVAQQACEPEWGKAASLGAPCWAEAVGCHTSGPQRLLEWQTPQDRGRLLRAPRVAARPQCPLARSAPTCRNACGSMRSARPQDGRRLHSGMEPLPASTHGMCLPPRPFSNGSLPPWSVGSSLAAAAPALGQAPPRRGRTPAGAAQGAPPALPRRPRVHARHRPGQPPRLPGAPPRAPSAALRCPCPRGPAARRLRSQPGASGRTSSARARRTPGPRPSRNAGPGHPACPSAAASAAR